MSKISHRRALLLAMIVPAMLVTGCAAGGGNSQAMKGAASPATPTEDMGSPEETGTGMESPEAGGARAAVQSYFDALKSGNVDKVVGSFADDAVVEINGAATAQGTDAIRNLYQKQLQGANGLKSATHSIQEERELGEASLVRATSKQGNNTFRDLFVLTQDGGEWKISNFMNNRGES
ncbi:MAG TPA: nuclear transport factor 2 family protein [Nonomuraea sp.]|nr:nuclear transport factor 2 family protein [Nonomuraea sp.]